MTPVTEKQVKAPKPKQAKGWEPGDTCYLKSGSPRMTITARSLAHSDHVEVLWVHYETGEMRSATVPVIALRKDWK